MIYLDSTAMAKLVVREPESSALVEWMNDRPNVPLLTSVVGRIALLRAASEESDTSGARARAFLTSVDVVALTPQIAEFAETIAAPLPADAAIHLATAYLLGPVDLTLCTYDEHLARAAVHLSIDTATPSNVDSPRPGGKS
ncbi:MAG: type II toxin-antitoxin system VapC family toxin [Rhodococcus sp. (in: high G+C Gram-positive bacteria)]|uniref:type II toxin-antitoxin system VapC family toxin n=1 Tax=Rhodococcus sp. TaxID=1831 RepID=UPI003BAE6EEF